jgi:regulator of RNase E activity RraB
MLLELSVVTELSAQFEALALKHHVSYDGWGAEIVE